MAVFRSILGDIRGSIAGSTFSRNGNSAYMRSRATPVNPRSSGQTLSRVALAFVSSIWRALTQAQQDGWKALALTVPYTNRLGESSFYSGFQLFVKLNKTLDSNGLPTISSAPAGAPAFPAFSVNSVQAEQDGSTFGLFSLNANTVFPVTATGMRLQVQATPAVSGGINFVNQSAYRTIGVYPNPSSASPLTLGVNWRAVFGIPDSSLIGGALFVRFRLLDDASGFTTPWIEQKTIVIEA